MKKVLNLAFFCVACLPTRASEDTVPNLDTVTIESNLSGPRLQLAYSNPVSNTAAVFNSTMGDLNLTVGDNSTVNWADSDVVSNVSNWQSGDSFNNTTNSDSWNEQSTHSTSIDTINDLQLAENSFQTDTSSFV